MPNSLAQKLPIPPSVFASKLGSQLTVNVQEATNTSQG